MMTGNLLTSDLADARGCAHGYEGHAELPMRPGPLLLFPHNVLWRGCGVRLHRSCAPPPRIDKSRLLAQQSQILWFRVTEPCESTEGPPVAAANR